MASDSRRAPAPQRRARARVPAVLDSAHAGDIQGAFGTIRSTTTASRTAGARGRWRCWRSWARA